MKNKFYIVAVLLMSFVLIGGAKAFAESEGGERMSEQHRDNVTKVVRELEKVADKDTNIREEVKTVAQEEKDMVASTTEKIEKAEKRNGFRTFLFGSDYKNLGALRSELMSTQNHVERLTKSLEKASNTDNKVELQTQIGELEGIRAKAEAFVKEQEGKFSLFGWLMRMFQ